MEIEVPAASPRTFSHITRRGRHILQLETVLIALYYPSALGSGNGKAPGGRRKWSRELWLPHPRSEMSKGYGDFAQVPPWLVLIWFFLTNGLRSYQLSGIPSSLVTGHRSKMQGKPAGRSRTRLENFPKVSQKNLCSPYHVQSWLGRNTDGI